jgi:hypothetical protein
MADHLAMRGAIAQLGERLNGIQEVRGSTPLGSTNKIKDLNHYIFHKQIIKRPMGNIWGNTMLP